MDIDRCSELSDEVLDTVSSVFVGDRELLELVMTGALANGHVLFEDLPGLGKTLLAKTFSRALGLAYNRIQFTPDLLPADITGTQIWREDSGFELVKGPIFGALILADEINRAPPKTQSALLEAMEERQVTIENETHDLNLPFFVLATQNPIEQEGTYPLPEAQRDRFLLKLSTGYPSSVEEEVELHRRRVEWAKDDPSMDVEPVLDRETFLGMQGAVEEEVYVDRSIMKYISQIVRGTRDDSRIKVGASPRGGLALLKLSRALALLRGRDFVTPDHVKTLAEPALGHRIILEMEQVLDEVDPGDMVDEVVASVEVPKDHEP